jgi:hypothetical protein
MATTATVTATTAVTATCLCDAGRRQRTEKGHRENDTAHMPRVIAPAVPGVESTS